jgi:hypothetical protein
MLCHRGVAARNRLFIAAFICLQARAHTLAGFGVQCGGRGERGGHVGKAGVVGVEGEGLVVETIGEEEDPEQCEEEGEVEREGGADVDDDEEEWYVVFGVVVWRRQAW